MNRCVKPCMLSLCILLAGFVMAVPGAAQSGTARAAAGSSEKPEPATAAPAQDGDLSTWGNGKLPRVEVTEESYDFGEVYRGHRLDHDFRIRNTGEADLVIKAVEPDCHCTASSAETDRIPPGGETVIHARMNTASLEGEVDKAIRVSTNDPGEPEAVLTLHGVIRVTAHLDPPKVRVDGYRFREEIPEQVVRIVPVEGVDLQVEKLIPQNRNHLISARLLEPDESGAIRVGITISTDTENSVETGRVMVRTNQERERFLRIPVKAVITQPYEVSPRTVSFTNIAADFEGALGYKVSIVNNEIEPLEIRDVRSESKFVEYQLVTVEAGQAYKLKLKVRPGFPKDGFTDKVVVVTSNEVRPETEITVEVNQKHPEKAEERRKHREELENRRGQGD